MNHKCKAPTWNRSPRPEPRSLIRALQSPCLALLLSAAAAAGGTTEVLKLPPAFQGKQFSVVRELDRGAFGTVYLVSVPTAAPGPKQSFVFKVFNRTVGKLTLEEMIAMETRPFPIIGSHPNIVACYGTLQIPLKRGATPETGVAMELLSRGDLKKFGERLAALSNAHAIDDTEKADAVRFIFRDLFAGLAAIHEKGYVHCDIKPANAMMAEDYSVKLIDFGTLTERGQTPITLSPYYADFTALTKVTGAFDVWSAGKWLHDWMRGTTFAYHGAMPNAWRDNPASRALTISDVFELKEGEETGIRAKLEGANAAYAALKQTIATNSLAAASREAILAVESGARDAVEKAVSARCAALRTIFKEHKPKAGGLLDPDYFDFQNSLLLPVPSERLTAGEALRHPFLNDSRLTPEYRQRLFAKITTATIATPSSETSKAGATPSSTDSTDSSSSGTGTGSSSDSDSDSSEPFSDFSRMLREQDSTP